MAKQIEHYCLSNGYDLMAVAAVPHHGESFWKSNGYKMQVEAAGNESNERMISAKAAWLRSNMLVFDDTPLYAKYLT